MEVLNDDCLFTIFKYLTVVDVIKVEQASPAFIEAAYIYYRNIQHFEFLLRNLDPDTVEPVLQRLGPTLKSFRFSGGFIMNADLKSKIINAIATNCSSLRSLTINYITMNYSCHVIPLLGVMQNLKELNLGNCPLTDEDLVPVLRSIVNLQKLTLNGNSSLKGNCLLVTPHLLKLDISFCFEVVTEHICDFIKSCTKLQHLNVSGCFKLNREQLLANLQSQVPPLDELVIMDQFCSEPSEEVKQEICFKLNRLKKLNGKVLT